MGKIFKWAFAGSIVGLALAAAAQTPNCPARPAPGTVVQDQLSLNSQNGTLQLALTLRNAPDIFGFMHFCFNYATAHGNVEAPTLRLNPGDTLNLDVTNQLNFVAPNVASPRYPTSGMMSDSMPGMEGAAEPPNTDPCKSQIMNFNTTNVHFHGLNIPPVCHQDDVLNTLIQPGPTPFHYQIQIPANEPPGLYWYHPHPHGFTTLQVNGGAAGAIIVNGIEKIKPQVAGLTERVFMIRQQFLNPLSWLPGPNQLTLNFQTAAAPLFQSPVIQMKPGEKQFWRIGNATTQAFLSLQVLFGSTAQTVELISVDGVPVTTNPMVSEIDVPPAGRAEFIVTGPAVGTAATFVTTGFDSGPIGNPNVPQILANVVATTGAVQSGQPVVPAANLPAVTQRFSGLAAMKPATQRKLFFSEAALGTNPPVNFFITVEGQQQKLFAKNAPPNIVTKVGEVEDWTIENHTSEEHAFHMHQIHFLVMAIDGVPLPNPTLQDTIAVPYWSGKGPFHKVRVRMDFRDPNIAGTFVFHCHVLFHEDGGMMGKIQVNP
jgi:FtsP/CotA-like multicopper oxidase with cupredoxin domain